MHRICLLTLVVVGMLGAGCAPHANFKSETIDVNGDALVIKGWSGDGNFCIELTLEPHDEQTSIYSVSVIKPDGQAVDPSNWSDKTPEAPKMNVGFGVGLGMLGSSKSGGHRREVRREGGHRSGRSGGSGWGLSPGVGVGVPLGGGKDDRITAIKACWELTAIGAALTECTLEVSLVSSVVNKVKLTRIPLAMAIAPEDETEKQKDDTESVKDLVREIDFTAKGPATTEILDPQA